MERIKLTAEQFFKGLLAAVRVRTERIEGEQTDVHRAFRRVLKEVSGANVLDVDLFDVDYDPLYGQSGWFDRALTTAQRDSILSFANPRYNKIFIRYGEEESRTILDAIGARPEFDRLATVFISSLEKPSTRGNSL